MGSKEELGKNKEDVFSKGNISKGLSVVVCKCYISSNKSLEQSSAWEPRPLGALVLIFHLFPTDLSKGLGMLFNGKAILKAMFTNFPIPLKTVSFYIKIISEFTKENILK